MARMHEYLSSLRGEDGMMTIPDDFDQGWEDAYNGDIADAGVNAASQVTLLQQELDAAKAELTEAQAANWRLSQVAPNNNNGPVETDADNGGDAPAGDDGEDKTPSVNDFFKPADKD